MDVAYAHGALYEGLVQRRVLRGRTSADLDSRAYFIIDDEGALERNPPEDFGHVGRIRLRLRLPGE